MLLECCVVSCPRASPLPGRPVRECPAEHLAAQVVVREVGHLGSEAEPGPVSPEQKLDQVSRGCGHALIDCHRASQAGELSDTSRYDRPPRSGPHRQALPGRPGWPARHRPSPLRLSGPPVSLWRPYPGSATLHWRAGMIRGRGPMGYGVIGSPTGSGPVSLGSSPGTPARCEARLPAKVAALACARGPVGADAVLRTASASTGGAGGLVPARSRGAGATLRRLRRSSR